MKSNMPPARSILAEQVEDALLWHVVEVDRKRYVEGKVSTLLEPQPGRPDVFHLVPIVDVEPVPDLRRGERNASPLGRDLGYQQW